MVSQLWCPNCGVPTVPNPLWSPNRKKPGEHSTDAKHGGVHGVPGSGGCCARGYLVGGYWVPGGGYWDHLYHLQGPPVPPAGTTLTTAGTPLTTAGTHYATVGTTMPLMGPHYTTVGTLFTTVGTLFTTDFG